MTPAGYRDLMRVARRHSRRADEAEDLVQDALLAAVAAGRDVDAPANRPWLVGAIRRRASFVARGAGRRARRELAWHDGQDEPVATGAPPPSSEILSGLPPSLKAVAALALSGHSRAEIRYLLRLTDAALRQRLTGLRRQMQARGIDFPATTPGLALDLDYGRIRDALLGKLLRAGGLFASHDPDGHLFVIRRSQSARSRQQAGGSTARSTP